MTESLNAGQRKMAEAMTERQLEDHVAARAKVYWLLYYHTYRSERSPSGFPDDVIVGPGGVIYRENKTEEGRVSKAQQEWLDRLIQAGQDAAVWRPSDLLSGRVDREMRALSARR